MAISDAFRRCLFRLLAYRYETKTIPAAMRKIPDETEVTILTKVFELELPLEMSGVGGSGGGDEVSFSFMTPVM